MIKVMKKKISYFSLLTFSFSSVFSNFLKFIKISSVPFLLCIPLSYLQTYIVLQTPLNKIIGMFIMATGLFTLPIFFAFLTNWHRYIIFDGKKPWKFKLIEFSNNTLKFTKATILIFLLISIPYFASILLSFYLGLKFNFGLYIIIIQWGLMFLFLYLYSKLALIFPAAAAGHSISLKRIFNLSKGYFWKILGGFLTFSLIFVIPSIIIAKIIGTSFIGSIYLNLFLFIIIFIFLAMNASWLSKIYRDINS